MNPKLAPNLIELTKDACLKAFWRKRALRSFLKQHRIKESKLATWPGEESKRDFLHRLFDDLLGVKDNAGHMVILDMARSLAEMTHFPDLERWEDSKEKLADARESVARLKKQVDSLKSQTEDKRAAEQRRRRANEQRETTLASRETIQKLRQRLDDLVPSQGTADAGYAFEKWFYDFAGYFEIVGRPPYKTDGRQIDGSLSLDGTEYLIETKFTTGKSGSPDIDVFMAKINSKAENTMGVFLSMSGFTSGAIKAASRERTPMLLMDYSHVYNLMLSELMSMPDVIRRIKRHASQTGEAFLSPSEFSG